MEASTEDSKVNENNNTLHEKVDETEANTTTEGSKGASSTAEASKKKKKKKRDSSTSAETQKAEEVDEKKEKGKDMKNADEKDTSNTEKTASDGEAVKETKVPSNDPSTGPVVSSSKRTRPPYKYDPEKVTLRFLFANRDGLTVTVECKPSDTVGEVKGQLLSVWPEGKISF